MNVISMPSTSLCMYTNANKDKDRKVDFLIWLLYLDTNI